MKLRGRPFHEVVTPYISLLAYFIIITFKFIFCKTKKNISRIIYVLIPTTGNKPKKKNNENMNTILGQRVYKKALVCACADREEEKTSVQDGVVHEWDVFWSAAVQCASRRWPRWSGPGGLPRHRYQSPGKQYSGG